MRRRFPHDWHSWHHPPRSPQWIAVRHKHRFVLLRFVFALGAILVPFAVALALIIAIKHRPDTGIRPLVLLGIPALFILGAALLSGIAFRRFGTPIVDVMAAADSVAEGDFSVRVREAPGQFGRLANSFNRMTAELARAEEQRRNLTADVAHELRTPLTIIQGNLEGILDGTYPASPDQLEATLGEVRLVARLVADLQTLSLAEAGQLTLHPVRFSVADLLSDTVTNFQFQAAEAGVELAADPCPPELELEADPDRLDQVLANLVANALHHTPSGGRIVLSCESVARGPQHAGGPGSGAVRIAVEDTGAGIPPENLPYVFDRFWKGDRARSRRLGSGSGLGLAIARQLVRAHGGEIRVSSTVGAGATFTIELPEAGVT